MNAPDPHYRIDDCMIERLNRSPYAFNPGPTNLQPVSGNLYVHRQFGPVNAAGEKIYETIIRNAVQEPVCFVDEWDAYHVGIGEIHCGTNLRAALDAMPM